LEIYEKLLKIDPTDAHIWQKIGEMHDELEHEKVAEELDFNDSVIFTEKELNQIIKYSLDNPDERTSKAYFDCLEKFAKENGGVIVGMWEIKYNMRGFLGTIQSI